ncbi:MAG: N-(5'-phosphoribosyl)anthranilate isomerase [Gemmatimonas sp.]|nr:N-(5'-phosphoribosyl)anthranilate isomerase [Gemmatimonas sp.]
MPQLKVCCISSVAEAELAVSHGAAALGLVSAMPSGPGVVEDAIIREVAAWARGRARSFLLTSRTEPAAIAEQLEQLQPETVQLVDALPDGAHRELRRLMPSVRQVQVIHVRSEADVAEALRVAPDVDELLLDSGNPALTVKELGGTGRTHDWSLSARIVRESPLPVWLAGGLRAENAAQAIATVRPHGLDVCSGVRREGKLDQVRLAALAAVLQA